MVVHNYGFIDKTIVPQEQVISNPNIYPLISIESSYNATIISLKRMDVCQSGFHDQKVQRRLVRVPVESAPSIILCDFCLSRIIEAQKEGGDLPMTILYQWAKEFGVHA
jgi:hypothetical protein